jgi:monovalent cation/hydrogen antiporter
VTVVEGESLVNDATGLIAFKFAVAAVVSGTFSLLDAGVEFVLTAAAGIAIGVIVGIVIAAVRRRLDDPTTEITISFLTPYLAYLPAEAVGASAVLAAVTSGIYLGWRAPLLISPQTRIEAYAFWRVVSFLINSALFVLIGLQLPAILDDLSGVSAGTLALDAVVVVLTVILVRFAWILPSTYVPRRIVPRWYAGDPGPPLSLTLLTAWTGMRGAVSLAAALAIPATVDGGGAFPDRALVVFLVYAVILATLLLQGLTLPVLIERLGLGAEESEERREALARIRAAEAAIERLDELAGEDWVRESSRVRMRGLYQFRVRRFGARFDDEDDGALEEGSQAYQRLRREALEAERDELLRLRTEGRISEEAMRRIERDLDLEDARLEI